MARVLDSFPDEGKLAANITHFARALRRAGIPVGTGRVVDAIRAVEAVGFTDKTDFYHTLQACFVSRPEQRQVFAQVFRLYWRDPQFMEHMMSILMPTLRGFNDRPDPGAAERRAAEALLDEAEMPAPQRREEDEEEIEIDLSLTASGEEKLKIHADAKVDALTVSKVMKVAAEAGILQFVLVTQRRADGG